MVHNQQLCRISADTKQQWNIAKERIAVTGFVVIPPELRSASQRQRLINQGSSSMTNSSTEDLQVTCIAASHLYYENFINDFSIEEDGKLRTLSQHETEWFTLLPDRLLVYRITLAPFETILYDPQVVFRDTKKKAFLFQSRKVPLPKQVGQKRTFFESLQNITTPKDVTMPPIHKPVFTPLGNLIYTLS